jgi:hypothetical protein
MIQVNLNLIYNNIFVYLYIYIMENQLNNIDDKMTKMLLLFENKFELLESRIQALENKMDILIGNSDDINISCSKMKGHIDFVENTYISVRTPLDFVKKNIEKLMGNIESDELPQIEYSSDKIK